jgi:hypothetical protein
LLASNAAVRVPDHLHPKLSLPPDRAAWRCSR